MARQPVGDGGDRLASAAAGTSETFVRERQFDPPILDEKTRWNNRSPSSPTERGPAHLQCRSTTATIRFGFGTTRAKKTLTISTTTAATSTHCLRASDADQPHVARYVGGHALELALRASSTTREFRLVSAAFTGSPSASTSLGGAARVGDRVGDLVGDPWMTAFVGPPRHTAHLCLVPIAHQEPAVAAEKKHLLRLWL